LPDLILIDGGKGHLSAAIEELSFLGIPEISVISLAKVLEKIFVKGQRAPILLPKDSKTLHLLQRIRNEAHRFAISYHKKLMQKRLTHSALDAIKGIGEKRKKLLLERFGSVENIRNAKAEDLASIQGLNERLSKSIIRRLKK